MLRLSSRCRRFLLLCLSCFFVTAVSAQAPAASKAASQTSPQAQVSPGEQKAAQEVSRTGKAHTGHTAHKKHKARKKHAPKLDRSGKARKGKASFYARSFAGKKMADGTPMNPNANIAASRTLPLGTKVQVTNLENGRSAVVEIRDRGPYVDGRIVDLSPKVAKKLKMIDDGVAPVLVEPIAVPQADGSIKPGDGALPDAELAQQDAAP